MSGLMMKYFVLKPSGDDAYAKASRAAMRAYASHIHDVNYKLCVELREWADREVPRPIAQATIPTARPGERYLGSIIEPNGSRVRHIFLLPGEAEKNWNDGMEWAKNLGGDLPDRIEQAMLLAFMPEEFQKKAY